MFKAILFDFDGVIIDSETSKFKSLNLILKEFNLKIDASYLHNFIGKKTNLILNDLFPNLSIEEKDFIVKERRNKLFDDLDNEKIILGFIDFIIFLKKQDLKLGVVTGSVKRIVQTVLESNDLVSFFDLIISGDDYDFSKANPQSYLLALEKMGVSEKDVLVIEDSPAGVKAGKIAGCKFFCIKNLS